MATSGTIRNEFRTGYAVQLLWNVTGQSVGGNTSTVRVRVQLVSTGSSYNINSTATKNGSVSINGTTYKFTFTAQLSGGQTKTLDDRTVTISHGSNGKKTCSFGFSTSLNVTLSGTYWSTISKSGSGTFDTIPRASTFDSVAAASKYADSAITYKYTPKASSFYNRLVVKVGGSTLATVNLGAKAASQQTGTLSLTSAQLNTVYSKYPKAVSAILAFTVETYSNSGYTSKVGTSAERKLTLTFPTSLVPTISNVAISEAVSGLAAKFGAYVQNKSKVKVVTSASGVSGSSISSIKVTMNGTTYTGSSVTSGFLTKSGTISISVKVTDTRGRVASQSKNISVASYSPPKVKTFTGFRAKSDGTEDYNGTYVKMNLSFSISSVGDKNDKSYTIEYKLKSASTWTAITSGSVYSLSSSPISGAVFNVDHAYDVRLKVTDYFGSDSKAIDIPTAFTLLDLRSTGKGIAFGKVSEKDGIEFGMETFFSRGETPSSAVVLKENTDLDALTTSGFYCFSSPVLTTMKNCPVSSGASGAVVVMDVGNAGQKMQIAIRCSTATEIWERMYYSSSWKPWKKVYNGSGKILWSGNYYMSDTQTASLSEKVSEQPSGIVLMFSRYVDGAGQNYGFNSFFVPKVMTAEQNGKGMAFTMNSGATIGVVGAKYLYINDDSIAGHADNKKSGVASSGITYNNAGFVLRYVIGV